MLIRGWLNLHVVPSIGIEYPYSCSYSGLFPVATTTDINLVPLEHVSVLCGIRRGSGTAFA